VEEKEKSYRIELNWLWFYENERNSIKLFPHTINFINVWRFFFNVNLVNDLHKKESKNISNRFLLWYWIKKKVATMINFLKLALKYTTVWIHNFASPRIKTDELIRSRKSITFIFSVTSFSQSVETSCKGWMKTKVKRIFFSFLLSQINRCFFQFLCSLHEPRMKRHRARNLLLLTYTINCVELSIEFVIDAQKMQLSMGFLLDFLFSTLFYVFFFNFVSLMINSSPTRFLLPTLADIALLFWLSIGWRSTGYFFFSSASVGKKYCREIRQEEFLVSSSQFQVIFLLFNATFIAHIKIYFYEM
jgi:hypothetical protein